MSKYQSCCASHIWDQNLNTKASLKKPSHVSIFEGIWKGVSSWKSLSNKRTRGINRASLLSLTWQFSITFKVLLSIEDVEGSFKTRRVFNDLLRVLKGVISHIRLHKITVAYWNICNKYCVTLLKYVDSTSCFKQTCRYPAHFSHNLSVANCWRVWRNIRR